VTSETTAGVAGRIRAFVKQRFPLAQTTDFADEDSLLEAGIIDSLGILDLVTFLEETFPVTIADDDLNPENFESVAALVRFVGARRS